jgi:predicted RNase H-like HicB family nuclease
MQATRQPVGADGAKHRLKANLPMASSLGLGNRARMADCGSRWRLLKGALIFLNHLSIFTKMIIKAVIHNAEEGGFWAEVPALPGCLTQGETREEIRENLLEAIELWFEAGEAGAVEKESQIMELAI